MKYINKNNFKKFMRISCLSIIAICSGYSGSAFAVIDLSTFLDYLTQYPDLITSSQLVSAYYELTPEDKCQLIMIYHESAPEDKWRVDESLDSLNLNIEELEQSALSEAAQALEDSFNAQQKETKLAKQESVEQEKVFADVSEEEALNKAYEESLLEAELVKERELLDDQMLVEAIKDSKVSDQNQLEQVEKNEILDDELLKAIEASFETLEAEKK